MADSHISLNANRIDIEAGRSDSKEKSRGQNVGGEVGVFAQAGAQTGVGVYATLGGGSNKVDGHSTTYHNSHLDSETVTINSQGDTTLRGAQAKGKTVNVNAGGDLNIESLQDEAEFKSRGNQMGVHAEISFGNAWSANANASAERGTTSRKQVNEQAGIFAEEGGYHVNANNLHLKGAAIASTNAENSELATNNFSFEDIENHSESSAVSGSISAGFSHQNERYEEKDSGKIIDQTDPRLTRGADGKINNPAVRTIAESNSPSLSPGMPMYQHSQDSTTTKSVLTEGKITLNKDSQPTQTTAAALGIQTSLENANNQVAQTENVQKQLAEQKEIREAIGNVQSAVNTYTANQATEAARAVEKLEEELAQAKAEGDNQKISEKTTALLSAQADAEAWQLGGSKKRTVDTVTAIITTALAGKTGAEIAVAASSPSINEFIHEKTKDNKAANLLAHAVLSATEFYVAGQDPLTGALAGLAGEGTAMLLAEKVFNKKPAELSAEEKETLRIASMLAGGLVGAVGNSSTSNNHGANGLASATEGMTTAKRAVENNYLYANEARRRKELSMLLQIESNPEKRKAYAEELAKLNQLDEERQRALENNCQAFNKDNEACRNSIVDAERARKSYLSTSSKDILQPGSNYPDTRTYNLIFVNDFSRVNEGLKDKDQHTIELEVIARNYVKRNGGSQEEVFQALQGFEAFSNVVSMAGAGQVGRGYWSLRAPKFTPKTDYSSGFKDEKGTLGEPIYPEGIHFNMNLKNHLRNVDEFTQKNGIRGAHNRDNFLKELLENRDGLVLRETKTGVDGITTITYAYPAFDGKGNRIRYKRSSHPKTVYEPRKFSDDLMLDLAQRAAAKGYIKALNEKREYTEQINGIKFQIYLDKETGRVDNVHPAK